MVKIVELLFLLSGSQQHILDNLPKELRGFTTSHLSDPSQSHCDMALVSKGVLCLNCLFALCRFPSEFLDFPLSRPWWQSFFSGAAFVTHGCSFPFMASPPGSLPRNGVTYCRSDMKPWFIGESTAGYGSVMAKQPKEAVQHGSCFYLCLEDFS